MSICVSTMNNFSMREARPPEGTGRGKEERIWGRKRRGARDGGSQKESRGQGRGGRQKEKAASFEAALPWVTL